MERSATFVLALAGALAAGAASAQAPDGSPVIELCKVSDWRGQRADLWKIAGETMSAWNPTQKIWERRCPVVAATERDTCNITPTSYRFEADSLDPSTGEAGYVLIVDIDRTSHAYAERGLDMADDGMSYGYGSCAPTPDPAGH